MITRLKSSALPLIVCLLLSDSTAFAGGPLDLVIPRVELHNVTLEGAIKELHQWGIPICFEKGVSDEQITFSISLRNASVKHILNALVSADKRYQWETYRSATLPPATLEIINILPINARADPQNLMNVKVSALELKDINPAQAVQRIYQLIPELKQKYWKRVAPGGVSSEIRPLTAPANEFFVSLKLNDVTVRSVLNELALRSGGICWIYEYSHTPPRHTWRVFY